MRETKDRGSVRALVSDVANGAPALVKADMGSDIGAGTGGTGESVVPKLCLT